MRSTSGKQCHVDPVRPYGSAWIILLGFYFKYRVLIVAVSITLTLNPTKALKRAPCVVAAPPPSPFGVPLACWHAAWLRVPDTKMRLRTPAWPSLSTHTRVYAQRREQHTAAR